MRNFRNLDVWQKSIQFCSDINAILTGFPDYEKFGLCNQIRRASVSIASNIAEGSSRRSSIEFSRYLQISMGSSFEIETQLIIANNNGYLTNEAFEALVNNLHLIQKKLNSLISVVKSWNKNL